MKVKTISRIVLIVILILFILISVNGQDIKDTTGEEAQIVLPETMIETPDVVEVQKPEPKITNLDVSLIDKINNNTVNLNNCVVVLAGELKICEDKFNYNNTFASGDMYKITILVEPKNKIKEGE
ncbi:MAG: hypothetical protein MUP69_10290 [Candidatus Atribacteria bacterium]|nr:hypothetical protein [Candidatus Atribacteria bacterium]